MLPGHYLTNNNTPCPQFFHTAKHATLRSLLANEIHQPLNYTPQVPKGHPCQPEKPACQPRRGSRFRGELTQKFDDTAAAHLVGGPQWI